SRAVIMSAPEVSEETVQHEDYQRGARHHEHQKPSAPVSEVESRSDATNLRNPYARIARVVIEDAGIALRDRDASLAQSPRLPRRPHHRNAGEDAQIDDSRHDDWQWRSG